MSAGPVRISGGAAAVKAPVLLLYGEEYANLALADELTLDGYDVRRASDAVTLRAACDTREIDVLILGQTAHRGCGLRCCASCAPERSRRMPSLGCARSG